MQYRDIAGVRARIDQAVAGLPGVPTDKTDEFNRLEMVCIQVLDSEHNLYLPGQLQELLACYLTMRQIELGLLQGADPQE